MALSQIQPQEEKQKGPSALENAAKVLGILTNIASVGIQGKNAFSPAAPSAPAIAKPKDPFFLDFTANKLGGK